MLIILETSYFSLLLGTREHELAHYICPFSKGIGSQYDLHKLVLSENKKRKINHALTCKAQLEPRIEEVDNVFWDKLDKLHHLMIKLGRLWMPLVKGWITWP